MALPTIAPYPMPTASELPPNTVSWTCDPQRALVLVHDVQQHFLDAFRPGASPRSDLLVNIQRLLHRCRVLDVPVAYSTQRGGQTRQERGLQHDFWGAGIPDDSHKTAVPQPLTPTDNDTVFTKWKYSAFVRTRLAELLAESGRDQLVLAGVYAHLGVLLTAADAWSRDIQTFVVADAIADFSPADHRMALRYAATSCAMVTSVHDVLAALAADPPHRATVPGVDPVAGAGSDSAPPAPVPD